MLGMALQARRPVDSRRRNRGESEQLESLLMDPEGVQKRRDLLLEMMKNERSRRRQKGEAVSSSDEEQDRRRVDVQLVGWRNRNPFVFRKRYSPFICVCLFFVLNACPILGPAGSDLTFFHDISMHDLIFSVW
jgi:hypothetical protein